MARATLQVVMTLNGAGVWRVVAPMDPAYVRHLTDAELQTLSDAIPALIESIVKVKVPSVAVPPKKKKK